jgi:hypothetical protein
VTQPNDPIYQSMQPTPQTGGYQVNPQTNEGAPVAAPAPVNTRSESPEEFEDRLSAMMEARIQKIQTDYDRKIRALEARQNAALKSARGIRAVDHLVPTHAGGPDNEIHETWGQYYQELAMRGELTPLLLARTSGELPPEEDSAEADVMSDV